MVRGWMPLRAAALACAVLAAGQQAQAAGAIAIGACAAYGYAYDYPTLPAARAAATKKCDGDCTQFVTTQKGCAAFAIDGHQPCGSMGYASRKSLADAQNTALRHCHQYGGRDCVIRAWICDARG